MRRMRLQILVMVMAAALLSTPALVAQRGAAPKVANPVVIQFMVDGIDHNTVRTAIANGATTLGSLLKQGVTVETYYCTSPAARLDLPDGSRPWGGSTSSNVAMHTGTHLFESYNIDDIFLSARRAGIKSVFAGGSRNYAIFKNADYLYYGGDELTDEIVVDRGLQHLTKDNARLLRLHLQLIRNAWHGPSDTTNPKSEYIQYFVKTVDPQLARLIAGLKSAGVWDRTYIIFGSDHGMGQTSQSGHRGRARHGRMQMRGERACVGVRAREEEMQARRRGHLRLRGLWRLLLAYDGDSRAIRGRADVTENPFARGVTHLP